MSGVRDVLAEHEALSKAFAKIRELQDQLARAEAIIAGLRSNIAHMADRPDAEQKIMHLHGALWAAERRAREERAQLLAKMAKLRALKKDAYERGRRAAMVSALAIKAFHLTAKAVQSTKVRPVTLADIDAAERLAP